jgi:hypothetical protein
MFGETLAALDLLSQEFDGHSPPARAIAIDARERLLRTLFTSYVFDLNRTTNLSRSQSSTSCRSTNRFRCFNQRSIISKGA